MIAVYILGGLFLLIALLLSTPLSVWIYYKEELQIRMTAYGIPIWNYPQATEENVAETASSAVKETPPKENRLAQLRTTFEQDGVAGTLSLLTEVASLLTRAVGRLLRCLTIRLLRIEMRISGDEAADTAMHFGEVCAVFYPLLSAATCGLRVKERQVQLQPDFLGEGTAVLLDVKIRVSLWKLAGAALCIGWDILKIYMRKDDENGRK